VHLEGFNGAVDVQSFLTLKSPLGGGPRCVLRPLLLSAAGE